MKLHLQFEVIDPSLRIGFEKYGDDGAVVGRKSEDEIITERAFLAGKLRIHLSVVAKGKQIAIQSELYPAQNREAALRAMRECLNYMGRAISQNVDVVWPELILTPVSTTG